MAGNRGKKKKAQKAKVVVKTVTVRKKSSKKKMGSMAPSGMSSSMHTAMSLSMQACSIYNPFCDEAYGAKFPDESFVKTVTWDIKAQPFVPTCDSSGRCASLLVGDVNQAVTCSTAAWPTYTGSTLAPLNTLISDVASYRLTSWGLRLRCSGSKMNTTGMVRIRLFSPMTGASLTSFNSITTYADDVFDVPLSSLIDKDYWIVPKPLGTSARIFRDFGTVTTTLASWVNPGWQVVMISVDGAVASSNSLEIAGYYHYEGTTIDGATSATFATKPPANNPLVVDAGASALERAGTIIEGAATKVDKMFQSNAFKYISAAIGGYYGGPQGAQMALGTTSAYKAIRNVD